MNKKNRNLESVCGKKSSMPARSVILPGVGPGSAYMAAELATATPRRLVEILYDEAIHLSRQAVEAFDNNNSELAAERLTRAAGLIQKLQASLYLEVRDGPCRELSELYDLAHRKLIEADFYRRREAVAEVISLLSSQRPSWSHFVRSLQKAPIQSESISMTSSWVG